MILVYLTKAFSHSILESNSLFIGISLLTVDIISQKPPFFNVLRLFLTFLPIKIIKSKKISRLNRLIYCEMIFTLFSSNSVISICIAGSTKTHYGAGRGNWTLATRSEAWHSTTKLYPHKLIILYKKYI